MKFYVIYSFDATQGSSISEYEPSDEGWVQTEDDDEWDYNYLAEENPHNAHIWKDGIHRKYVHDSLDKESFLKFIKEMGLYYEDVETMGSLTDIGWLPAFSFNGDGMSYYDQAGIISINAYVTPMPEPVREMFTVTHPRNQESFWPLSEKELEEYHDKKMGRYWLMIKQAFKGQ